MCTDMKQNKLTQKKNSFGQYGSGFAENLFLE